MNTPSKPYILSAFDHVFKTGAYFSSLRGVLGNTVRPICIMYEPHEHIDLPLEGQLIKLPKKYPGNTGKYRDYRELLPQLNLDKDAWFISTDVHDVLFQKYLPPFPDDADILITSEGKTFGEIDFWKQRFPEYMSSWPAYNVGTFAMRYQPLMDFLNLIEFRWKRFLEWYKAENKINVVAGDGFPFTGVLLEKDLKQYIARVFNSFADTLIFNQFIRMEIYRTKEIPDFFSCWAYNYELGNIVENNGVTYTKNGLVPSIVHYNGSTKEFIRKEA